MGIGNHLRICLSLVALGVSGTTAALAGFPTLQLEHSFQQNFNKSVRSLAIQNDGKILVGGEFDVASNSGSHPYLVRLEPDNGEIDHSFRVDADGPITHVAARNDGTIVVAGSFTRIGGSSVSRVAILGADGRLQSRFNFSPSGPVTALFIKPDGKVLLAGSGMSGQSLFYWLVQASAEGRYDSSFNSSNINGPVYAIAAKSDGKILLGGEFTSVGTTPRSNLALLSSNGPVDPSFNVTVNSKVSGVQVQADDKIFLAGDFTQIGNMARTRLGRISSAGVPDTSFQAGINLDGPVESMALQANGNLVIGGSLESKAAVLGSTGSVVAVYDLGGYASVSALALDGEGRVLIGTRNSPTQTFLLRALASEPSTQTVTATSQNRIDWTRAGALPEVDSAEVDLWSNSSWTPLGAMTRTAGGWVKTGLTLPPGSWLRTQGNYRSGQFNGSRSSVQVIRSYGNVPDVAVEDANGTSIAASGSTVSFGSQNWLTAGPEELFTIRNTGAGPLNNLSVTVPTGHSGDFVLSPPASSSLAAGASTTFRVTFFPRGGGDRHAKLVIQSDDYDESSFDVALSGLGIHQDSTYLPSFSDDLYNIALLPDGCVIAGGRFTQVNGESRNYLTKLRPDGSLDPAFSVNLNGQIYSVQVQRDGKLFVAGTFNSVNGINLATGTAHLARLHPNGSLDLGFTPQAFSSGSPSVRLLPNGKILMMSPITDSQGAARGRLIRLNDDGSIDAGFNSDATTTGAYSNFANFSIQDDGKIVVIGNFGSVGGISRRGVARFLPDGAVDGSFIPPVTISSPSSIAVQPDGRILLAGLVKNVNYTAVSGTVRLLPEGSIDSSFNAIQGGAIMGLQTDGKIWVSGTKYDINNSLWNGFRRLFPNGAEDDSMDVRANNPLYGLTQTSEGSILVGGVFTNIGGVNRNRLARLPNNISASQTFAATSPSRVEWLRGGSSPEISQVIIEKWDGSIWSSLGAASRITGGWELPGLSLGASGYLRARGSSVFPGASSHFEQTVSYNFTGAALTPVLQWRVIHFGSHENTGIAANDQDFDNDGVANLVEYAMGSSPIDATSSAKPQIGWESLGGANQFVISFTKAAEATGIELIQESSNDLATWYSDAAHVTTVENSPSLLRFRATDPSATVFLRVRVVETPPSGS